MQQTLERIIRLLKIASFFVILASVLYLLLILVFGWHSPVVLYWFALSQPSPNLIIAFVMLLPIGVAFILSTRVLYRKSAANLHSAVTDTVFVIVLSSMCMCVATTAHQWQGAGFHEHIQTLHLNHTTYHLHFYSIDAAETYTHRYYLLECDSFDLFCRKTYSIARTNGGITPDVEQIALVANDEAQILSLQVNGEIVYTHRP